MQDHPINEVWIEGYGYRTTLTQAEVDDLVRDEELEESERVDFEFIAFDRLPTWEESCFNRKAPANLNRHV